MLKLLVEAGASQILRDKNGKTVLFYARNSWTINYLSTLPYIDLNARDTNGDTALTSAVRTASFIWYIDIIKPLIKAGSDANVKGKDGLTALMYAALNHNSELVALLLKSGADVAIQCDKGKTALQWAYTNFDKNKSRCLEVIYYLLSAGAEAADINAADKEGETALMKAVMYK